MTKSKFEKLQTRLETIPDYFYQLDPEGYRFVCETILMEEGWSEEEYLGCLIRKVENGEVRLGQNDRSGKSLG